MAAGNWTLVNTAVADILNGTIDLQGTIKVALHHSGSDISTSATTWAGVSGEVAPSNGYTAGGVAVTLTATGTTSVKLSFSSNPSWTASGGSIVAYWAVLYEVGGNVIAFCLLDNTPASVTIGSGNTLAIDSDGSPNPICTFTVS